MLDIFLDPGTVIRTLAALAVLALAVGVILTVFLALPSGREAASRDTGTALRFLLAFAFVVSAIATWGSLYLSDVVGFTPCLLCWYQRIAMYPLVPVLGVATLIGDGKVWRYGLPLSVIGLAISAYHVTIQYRPALDAGTCSADVPCTMRYLHVFGFVSIPVMAGSAFLLISALLVTAALGARGASEEEAES